MRLRIDIIKPFPHSHGGAAQHRPLPMLFLLVRAEANTNARRHLAVCPAAESESVPDAGQRWLGLMHEVLALRAFSFLIPLLSPLMIFYFKLRKYRGG